MGLLCGAWRALTRRLGRRRRVVAQALGVGDGVMLGSAPRIKSGVDAEFDAAVFRLGDAVVYAF